MSRSNIRWQRQGTQWAGETFITVFFSQPEWISGHHFEINGAVVRVTTVFAHPRIREKGEEIHEEAPNPNPIQFPAWHEAKKKH